MSDKCNDNWHKFGSYSIDNEKRIFRECLCCGKKSYYPNDEDIKIQLRNQEDTFSMISVLLDNNIDIIQSSDDYVKLVAWLNDHLSYLYIGKDTQNILLEKLSTFNNFFNKNNLERLGLINGFIEYLQLYFEKENMEARFGLNTFPEDGYTQLDLMFKSIENSFDKEIEILVDKENEKNHPIK